MIACVCMVRDEADILPAFLAHAAALFDLVLAVNHASADATPALLAAAPGVETFRLDEPGYWQSAVTTALTRAAFARDAEWVIPLDADEFLDVPSREALRGMLGSGRAPLVNFRWRHAVPALDDPGFPSPRWLANPAPARPGLCKIAIHRRVAAALPGFEIGAGNHSLRGAPFAKALQGETIGTLWHLPVRSRAQFTAKLARDLATHGGIPEQSHALSVKRRLAERLATDANGTLLRRIALGYWERGVACLDDEGPTAIPVTPSIATAPIILSRCTGEGGTRASCRRHAFGTTRGRVRAAQPPKPNNDIPPLPPTTLLAQATLTDGRITLHPSPASHQRLAALESWLTRHFTPGLRLARHVATRHVCRRLHGA